MLFVPCCVYCYGNRSELFLLKTFDLSPGLAIWMGGLFLQTEQLISLPAAAEIRSADRLEMQRYVPRTGQAARVLIMGVVLLPVLLCIQHAWVL